MAHQQVKYHQLLSLRLTTPSHIGYYDEYRSARTHCVGVKISKKAVMETRLRELGNLVKACREKKGISQEALARACGTNRSVVAHLEQGIREPGANVLDLIRDHLAIPESQWHRFVDPESQLRIEFENHLAELVGSDISLEQDDDREGVVTTAERQIKLLFTKTRSDSETFDLFNTILVYYGVSPVSHDFFKTYLGPGAFGSMTKFKEAVTTYQMDAIRLFSTFGEAYREMNGTDNLPDLLSSLKERKPSQYYDRSDWDLIDNIEDDHLPDLGYISVARVRQETAERQTLVTFLEELAKKIRKEGTQVIQSYQERQRRRIDSLLRKFDSRIEHGLFSPLFAPDPDALKREAIRLAPKSESELARMEETQRKALRNLSSYLTADYMDVYVATSMRSDADFVSVNQFVVSLFQHPDIRPLKLRYFNPTQSWIEDRIAKGLVEALMLRRAEITIYMAQKTDTFGKDSEASVALGQGKPVIVYVPKLILKDDPQTDTESLARMERTQLVTILVQEEDGTDSGTDIDDAIDDESLIGRILVGRLRKASDEQISDAVKRHWSDFDLYGESERISDNLKRSKYREWLDDTTKGSGGLPIPADIRDNVIGILVAVAIRFEGRARLFREIHPLALQVILSSGVLNGILVVRSVEQCARILRMLIENRLELTMSKDHLNYRLVERSTGSTVRVISRHKLLRNAFEIHYWQKRRSS